MDEEISSVPKDEILKQRLAEIKRVLPEEQKGYLKSISSKHFDKKTAVGSRFTKTESLENLLITAIEQRGSLDGDDRQKLIDMGISPDALLKDCRYLIVESEGTLGIARASDLSPDTKVKVVRTKPNTPSSLVVEQENLPVTNLGTIIIGPNVKDKEDDPEPSTQEMIWTAHPGPPVRPAREDIWEEGSTITVKDAVDRLGENIYFNVQQIEPSEPQEKNDNQSGAPSPGGGVDIIS